MRKYLSIILALITWLTLNGATDPHLSQFYASPMYLAPSFAGSTGGTRIALNYRDQWPKMPGSFITYAASVDHYFSEYKSGLGLMIMRDQAGGGKLNLTDISAQYAYNIEINNTWHVRPGLEFSYLNKHKDYSKFVFGDQLDFDENNPTTIEIPTDDRINYYDFAISTLAHNKDIWFGGTIDHLINLNKALSEKNNYPEIKYAIFGGGNISLQKSYYKKEVNKILLAFHFRSQETNQQLDFGTYYQKNELLVGLWYRGIPVFAKSPTHDALTVMLGYKLNGFSIGYSYDITISKLITHTGGAHELSFIYEIQEQYGFSNRRRRITAVPCPIF